MLEYLWICWVVCDWPAVCRAWRNLTHFPFMNLGWSQITWAQKEENLQEVPVPWSWPGSASWLVIRPADAACPCQSKEKILQRVEEEAPCFDQKAEEGQEGSSRNGEASRRQNPSPQHDCLARHDWKHRWSSQWKNFQPSRNQGILFVYNWIFGH